MLGLCKDTQAPKLTVQILHEGLHTRRDDAKVVVIHFLALGRPRAKKRAAGVNQVLAL